MRTMTDTWLEQQGYSVTREINRAGWTIRGKGKQIFLPATDVLNKTFEEIKEIIHSCLL